MSITAPATTAEMSAYVALDSCSKVADRFRSELHRAGLAVAFEWRSAAHLRELCGIDLSPSLAFGVIAPLVALRIAVQNPLAVFESVMPVILVERNGQTHIFCGRRTANAEQQIRKLEEAIYATGGRATASHTLTFSGYDPTRYGC